MANPQKENGHTAIANEIVEALAKTSLTSYESRILWVLFRKTYGWNKKHDSISLSQFSELTNIHPQHIARSIKQLKERNIILVARDSHSNLYQFQKNYELWDKLTAPPTTNLGTTNLGTTNLGTTKIDRQVLPEMVREVLPEMVLTKDMKDMKDTNIYIYNSPDKKVYGEFKNVTLLEVEYQKLIDKFGSDEASVKIEGLSSAKASKGLKYKSDYATILNWARRDNGQHSIGTQEQAITQNGKNKYTSGKYGGLVRT